jgi:hypothetical protein
MKRLWVLILVFLVCLTGCSASGGEAFSSSPAVSPIQSEGNPDIPGIMAQQDKALNSITTCRASVYLEINIHSGTTTKADMSLTANMKASFDKPNRLLSSVVVTTIVINDAKKEMEQQIIGENESIYVKDSAQSPWQLKSLDESAAEKLWIEQNSQLSGLKYAELMSPESLVYSGQEQSNGHRCWVFKQLLEGDKLGDITPELQQQLQNLQGLTADSLEKIIKDARATYLIDEQSYYLREFRLDAQVAQVIQGQQVTGTLTQYNRFDAFNEPVSIEIPEVK